MRALVSFVWVAWLGIFSCFSQEVDFGRLSVAPVLSSKVSALDPDMANALVVKLERILTQNDLAVGTEGSTRFLLAGSVLLDAKDVSATVPAMYSVKLDIQISFGDGLDGVLFNSISIVGSGLERSEKKAYLAAVRALNPSAADIKSFMASSKEKVSVYYAKKCKVLTSEATALATQFRYDEALFKLQEVPTLSDQCFEEVRALSIQIFKQKSEYECTQILSKLDAALLNTQYDNVSLYIEQLASTQNCYQANKEAIAKAQNVLCQYYLTRAKDSWSVHDYNTSLGWLAKIPASAGCTSEASVLTKEIGSWYAKQEKRELDLEIYKYKQEQERKKELIKAMRDVGVAFGKGQPKVIVKRTWF